MIPKIIHYCWLGGNEKPQLLLDCIESWKKYCPDYEIIEWNESNFDVNFCQYSKEAYEAKKWGFVPDVIRTKVIYDHGGIYLDTDVMLNNSLDDLLGYDAFFAQDDIRWIPLGLGFGAEKGNELIKQLLDARLNRPFDTTVCNYIDTPVIRKYLNMPQSRTSQCINNVLIIGVEDYEKYAKHMYVGSWKDEETRKLTERAANRFPKLKYKLRDPKIFNRLEKNGETWFSKLYVFCVYDLLDNGLWYFIKLFFKKIKKKIIK